MDRLLKHQTHYSLTEYKKGECYELEVAFSVYVKFPRSGYGKYEPVGLIHDKESGTLYLPGGANPYMIEKITGLKTIKLATHDDYDLISIRPKATPFNDLQKEMVQWLIGEGKYVENKNHSQLACNAQTGQGKTYAAIMLMSYFKAKTIVIVNRENIRNIWVGEMLKFTDIDVKRIAVLKTDTIDAIIKGEFDTSQYVAFVVLHQTLRAYAKKSEYGWRSISELFRKLKVGLKIYDEANQEFANTLHVDAYTNTFKTVYLTATMQRAGDQENKVFQRAFKTVPKFDPYALGYTDAKKHITMLVIKYNSHPPVSVVSECLKGGRGFNSKTYSDYQVYQDPRFFEILFELTEKFAVTNKFRTLILVSKINSCEIIAERLKETFPEKKIGIYNSSIHPTEKKRVVSECDIIVSITKSLGFAETIPYLKAVLNFEAFSFVGTGDQASGRLRFLYGDNCWYVEIADLGFLSIRKQLNKRLRAYKGIYKDIIQLNA